MCHCVPHFEYKMSEDRKRIITNVTEKDYDLIDFLNTKSNKSNYVLSLIRRDMNMEINFNTNLINDIEQVVSNLLDTKLSTLNITTIESPTIISPEPIAIIEPIAPTIEDNNIVAVTECNKEKEIIEDFNVEDYNKTALNDLTAVEDLDEFY